MVLPNELIQEFAKLTNDTDRKTPNNVMYGTIVDYNDSKWVRIDGSDLLTPISSITNVSDGDRVIVGIQNHKAIINGNLTYPSTTSPVVERISGQVATNIAGKLVADELEAEFIRVGVLLSDYIKVDQLDAAVINSEIINAKFIDVEDLKADRIEVDQLIADSIKAERIEVEDLIADSITADRIEVEDLIADSITAERAEIDELIAKKADIADLNATNANIGNLSAEVADINTLIFGSATGDTIHVNFANAVVQQIGDAQIKSAMIESISAGKITAGDIITNNVRVMSEDGSLLISDQTIQIKDDKRVRVQIGEDASGDYSIYIWDANGNLMFDPTGVQEKGITKAIIKNDMVNANANISASKLDIDSLFTEINGSTKTIKSTKIYLDAEKQTLDVVFKSMDTTVTKMGETISSQGTQISTIQGQISSKIWQQDITTATTPLGNSINALNTQYSSLNQTVSGLSSTVSSHTSEIAKKADASTVESVYATKTEVSQTSKDIQLVASRTTTNENDIASLKLTADGLSVALDELAIGGRNLVAGTDRTTVHSGNKGSYIYKDVWTGTTIDIPTATEYIVSFDAKADVAQTIKCFFYSPNTTLTSESSTGDKKTNIGDGSSTVDITTEWARYWVKWTQTVPTAVKNIIVGRNETTNNIYIRAVKFEEGHVPTSWTPAPEDVDSDISSAAKTATNFMSYDSTNGLLIGNKSSGSWSGNRAQITSNAFNILNSSGKQLASFGETVTIGKNSSTDRYVYIDSDSVDIRHGTIALTSISDNKIVLGNAISKYDNLNKPVGENLTIDANGLVFRKGPNEIVAAFKTDEIVLGADTSTSRILLCGGAGAIYAGGLSNSNVWDMLQLDSTNLRLTGITETLTEATSSVGGGNGTLRGTSHQIHGSNTSGSYTGDYMQSYISSSFAQRNGTTTGQAYIGTTVYADYPDISAATINATDGTNTSYISVCPTYIDIDTTTLMIGGNTSITGNLLTTGKLTVSGQTTLSKPVSITDTLTVAGQSTFNNAVNMKGGVEIFLGTPFIDFHFGNSTADYTSRIIENSSGVLTVTGGLKVNGAFTASSTATVTGDLTSNGTTNLNGNTIIANEASGGGLDFVDADGVIRNLLHVNSSNNLSLGGGLHTLGQGTTFVYGGVAVHQAINISGTTYATQLKQISGSAAPVQFSPSPTNKIYLGSSSNRWYSVYAQTTTIQTSDRREKENITPLGVSPISTFGMRSAPEERIDVHSELFDRLQPVQYNFNDGNERVYYGLIAQDVISILEELGIGENELDLVHHEWHTDEETGEEKDTYGIAYANLIALLIHEVQKLKTEVNILKGEQNNG